MRIILLFMLLFWLYGVQAQKKHTDKQVLRPGLAIAYLPTWLLDDYHGNTPARVFVMGLNGHQEIWKESVFIMGIAYGKIVENKTDYYTGIIVPFKLQKFFTPDRKGFNLSIGLLMNYCKTCQSRIAGAYSQEISYLFSGQHVQVNVGFQLVEGALFAKSAFHIGGHLQLIYQPQ